MLNGAFAEKSSRVTSFMVGCQSGFKLSVIVPKPNQLLLTQLPDYFRHSIENCSTRDARGYLLLLMFSLLRK